MGETFQMGLAEIPLGGLWGAPREPPMGGGAPIQPPMGAPGTVAIWLLHFLLRRVPLQRRQVNAQQQLLLRQLLQKLVKQQQQQQQTLTGRTRRARNSGTEVHQ